MKFYLYTYVCADCGHRFKAPEVMPSSYGEFLMRSISGETVFLDGPHDAIYSEVDALLEQLLQGQGVSAVRRADLLRKVFGVACDPDSQGQPFSLLIKPRCGQCASVNMDYWEGTEPPEYVDCDFPPVQHEQWRQLSQGQKLDLLRQALPAPRP
ncbi:MAG: hypothetical protein ACN6QY_07075 [Pseudomonas sp.]|uniref:hypothetical protein n=1 Tax=unclassified Pseudomonas TaxID=196821 RepID=UPI001CFB73AF|nr:hypothetical protein [Pseudomonas sp. L5B5]UCZ84776.1 hypothetical protein LGQ10_00175 [Pseudomonas sp. L5B5]